MAAGRARLPERRATDYSVRDSLAPWGELGVTYVCHLACCRHEQPQCIERRPLLSERPSSTQPIGRNMRVGIGSFDKTRTYTLLSWSANLIDDITWAS